MIAPAAVAAVLKRTEGTEIAHGDAAGNAAFAISEAAAGPARLKARVAAPGFRFQQDRAAQRVESIDGARVEQAELADRGFGDWRSGSSCPNLA